MSIQMVAWALETPCGSVSRKAVLIALANCHNHHTGLCCPSISRIGRETDLSESTVLRCLTDLEENGLIIREPRQRKNGSHTTTQYTFPVIAEMAHAQEWLRRQGVLPHSEGTPSPTVTPPEPEVRTGSEQDLAAAPRAGSNAIKNEIWDKLVQMFGEPATQSEKTKRGKIVWSLVRAGATAEEIHKRAQTWPQHFGDVTLTETALEAHYTRLGRKPLRRR